jgi:hypothetical protein
VESIRDGFKSAIARGLITREAAETFANQNEKAVMNMTQAGSPVRSILSKNDIYKFAKAYGFEILDVSDCYVVQTADGPKPFFIQFRIRKTGQRRSSN